MMKFQFVKYKLEQRCIKKKKKGGGEKQIKLNLKIII